MDLEKYWSFAYISAELGMSKHYMLIKERQQSIISKRIGYAKLFELSNEFIERIEKGFSCFKIKNKDDEEYAKETIEMQGLKIGFY